MSEDGLSRMEFRDTGYGIREDSRELLFQPFERLGNQTAEGTGLGLALSRQLVELMGGSLELVSSGPEGTVFCMTLRSVDAPLVAAKEAVAANGHSLSPLHAKILCIEDNLANLNLLEHIFAEWPNVTLIPAMQGSIGLDLAAEHLPTLILLDVHLPDMNGAEVLKRLKGDPRTAAIPVVAVSADATSSQRRAMLAAGAVAYVTKPIDIKTLTETIEALFD
jgi:CheY-like chemotaxis protein